MTDEFSDKDLEDLLSDLNNEELPPLDSEDKTSSEPEIDIDDADVDKLIKDIDEDIELGDAEEESIPVDENIVDNFIEEEQTSESEEASDEDVDMLLKELDTEQNEEPDMTQISIDKEDSFSTQDEVNNIEEPKEIEKEEIPVEDINVSEEEDVLKEKEISDDLDLSDIEEIEPEKQSKNIEQVKEEVLDLKQDENIHTEQVPEKIEAIADEEKEEKDESSEEPFGDKVKDTVEDVEETDEEIETKEVTDEAGDLEDFDIDDLVKSDIETGKEDHEQEEETLEEKEDVQTLDITDLKDSRIEETFGEADKPKAKAPSAPEEINEIETAPKQEEKTVDDAPELKTEEKEEFDDLQIEDELAEIDSSDEEQIEISLESAVDCYKNRNYEKAKQVINNLLEQRENSKYYYVLSLINRKEGDIKECEKNLLKTLSLRPDDVNALCNLAGVYYYKNNYKEAYKLISTAYKYIPEDEDIKANYELITSLVSKKKKK